MSGLERGDFPSDAQGLNIPEEDAIMCERLITHKRKTDFCPFPEELLMKSCIMDAAHNEGGVSEFSAKD